MSRFSLDEDQAKMIYVHEVREQHGLDFTDADIIENPYRIFELTRVTASPVAITTIDHGVFPDRIIRDKHPLPKPSTLESGTDSRRVRALAVCLLEGASSNGDTLIPRSELVRRLRDWEIRPKCEVTGDLLSVVEEHFSPEINLRGMPYGVAALNRFMHHHFRQATIDFARRTRYRKIPKPLGPDEIVYGDKVICIRNHRRYKVWPEEEAQQYVANGEVG